LEKKTGRKTVMQWKNVQDEEKKSARTRKGNELISGTAWLIREQWRAVS
jgi:hypothetical protein